MLVTSIALRSQPKVFDLCMYHDFGWAQHPISDVLNQKVYNYNAYAFMTVIAEEQYQCPEEYNVKDENDTRPQQPIVLLPRPKGFDLMLHREAEMHAMLSQALERCESLKMEAADAQRRAKKKECHCPPWRIHGANNARFICLRDQCCSFICSAMLEKTGDTFRDSNTFHTMGSKRDIA